jgi:toxin YoeB
MIDGATRSPFRGLGKPEPLKGDLKGWWSRRIDDEHRLVYRLIGSGDDQRIEVSQCRWHY